MGAPCPRRQSRSRCQDPISVGARVDRLRFAVSPNLPNFLRDNKRPELSWIEQQPSKLWVAGSNPAGRTFSKSPNRNSFHVRWPLGAEPKWRLWITPFKKGASRTTWNGYRTPK